MTTFLIFLGIYALSALIVGSMHWAGYQDAKKAGDDISSREKALNLYIIPLCPAVNTIVGIGIIANYFNL